jgi:cell division septum initiation protein DivIVA
MSKGADKIKDKLKQFEKRNLALRKEIAKRQKRIDARTDTRQNTLRAIDRATTSIEPNQNGAEKT